MNTSTSNRITPKLGCLTKFDCNQSKMKSSREVDSTCTRVYKCYLDVVSCNDIEPPHEHVMDLGLPIGLVFNSENIPASSNRNEISEYRRGPLHMLITIQRPASCVFPFTNRRDIASTSCRVIQSVHLKMKRPILVYRN